MIRKSIRSIAGRVIVGCTAALLITWIAFRFNFNLSSATSIHLFLVTAIALRWGFLEASFVSMLSVACLDYFFTLPLFKFYMTDSHDWVALATFESVALLVSRLSNQVGRHALESEMHRLRSEKLYELSQNILLLDRQKPVEQQMTDLIHDTLGVKGVALANLYSSHICLSGTCNVTAEELHLSLSKERNEDDSATSTSWRVLRSGTRSIGTLFISGHSLDVASINATASLTAVAIERARSFLAESSAEAARQSEQLRSAVLDGLAHAFKTPLTTIQSSSSGLIEMNTLSGTEKKLVLLIDHYAAHLSELTTRLLRTARVDNANLKVKPERLDLEQLLRDSIEESEQELGICHIKLVHGSRRVMVRADKQLIKMALFQLFDNASKYGSPEPSITVGTKEEQAETIISIQNEGSYIRPEEREQIFKRFYRTLGSDHRASGTGIGLSVVKHVAEAHLGRAWVESDQHTGTTFFLALPRMGKDS